MTRTMRVLTPLLSLLLVLVGARASAQPVPPSPQETAEAAEVAAEPSALAFDDPATIEERVREQVAELTEPGGLTADQAAEKAIATAPGLRRAAAAVAAAEAGARRAWQGFFPQAEVSARYTRLSPIDQPSFGGGLISADQANAARLLAMGVDDPEAQLLWDNLIDTFSDDTGFTFPVILNQYVIRGSVTVPVSDLFLTILPGYRAAQAAVDVSQAQVAAERAQVAYRAREAYYQLARARGAAVVARKSIEQVEANQQRIATLVEAGAAAQVDLLQINASLARTRVAAAQADSGARIAERALQLLIHEDGPIVLGEDLATEPPAPQAGVDALTEQALRDRTELEALRQLVAARERSIRATLGRQYPQLLVQGNIDIANPNQRIIPQQQEFNTTWDLSVVLRWSPNEMGAARAQAAEAEAQLEQARQDIANLSDAVRLEVSEAHSSVEAAHLAFEASRVGLVAAEAEHQVRMAQLEAGAAVTSDVLDAETSVTRARLQLIDAAIELRLARARLDKAIGDVE